MARMEDNGLVKRCQGGWRQIDMIITARDPGRHAINHDDEKPANATDGLVVYYQHARKDCSITHTHHTLI